MSDSDSEHICRLKKSISDIMGSDALGFDEKHKRALIIRDIVGAELAICIAPSLNKQITETECPTLSSKRELCSWINNHLRVIGLAIRQPLGPSIVIADPSGVDQNDSGRFRFETRDRNNEKTRSASMPSLSSIELVADRPRLEGRAKGARGV